jgi:tetratricopeptide (TPR) repeat protein
MPTIKKRGFATKKQHEQEMLTMTHHAFEFLATYKKQMIAVAAVIVAALALAAGYAVLRSTQEQKAAPLVAVAYEHYSPAGGSPADYQKALALFRDVQKKYSGTTSGAIAAYYVGNCLANLGQPEEALKEYQQFIKDHSGEKFLLGLVYQRMGYVYVGLNKQAEAIKAWEQAEKVSGPGLPTIELARLYESTGNVSEAQNKYKLVKEKLGGTIWAMEAVAKMPKTDLPTPFPGAAKEAK